MTYKSPKLFHFLLFIICSFGLFLTFDSYKQKQINESLQTSKKDIIYKYDELLKKYFEFGELIYFNEIIKSKTILNILKNQSSNNPALCNS